MIGFDLLVAWVYLARYLVPAQVSPVNPSAFETYGPIGIVAGVFASIAWMMFRKYEQTLDLERQRSARAEQQVHDLERSVREQTVPALLQSASTMAEVIKILEKRRRDE